LQLKKISNRKDLNVSLQPESSRSGTLLINQRQLNSMTFWSFLSNFATEVTKCKSLFHTLWNRDPFSIPIPLFRRAVSLFKHVIRKMYNNSTFFLKNSSTFYGTVPQEVVIIHLVSVFLDTVRSPKWSQCTSIPLHSWWPIITRQLPSC
jgi:hypothetical protein